MNSPDSRPSEQQEAAPDAMTSEEIYAIDRAHIWHPYASFASDTPLFTVRSAKGVEITLTDGRTLIDGMASWWSAIHGYNHPAMNQAATDQLGKMSHVMFGGLTHEPAARLAKTLVNITPDGLDRVFFSDSGSVAVEVALKMAIQYWSSQGQHKKNRLLTLKRGYHGDTFGAMSVCDPETGMHQLFSGTIRENIFCEAPECAFDAPWEEAFIEDFSEKLHNHADEIAAVILEPIVQGTGGMRFYSPIYLKKVRALCDQYGVLLIADEIATGFGRTGKLFACEHADISPDILCVGKALTGGYLSLAATLCTQHVSDTICAGGAGVFMHGPTFMANPLACAIAQKSIDLLFTNDWQAQVVRVGKALRRGLHDCQSLDSVEDVRVIGAIGVVEMKNNVDVNTLQPQFVEQGIWLRPFGKLVYMMPPYISSDKDINTLCAATYRVLAEHA